MTQLYTVVNQNDGYNLGEGLTLLEATHEVLSYDDYEYEIRQGGDGIFRLYLSQFSRCSANGGGPLVKSVFFSLESDKKAATADIAQQVIRSDWPKLAVHTDEEYAEIERRLALELAEE